MPRVGRVLGTEDSTPLEFWVGIEEETYLQLDDVVMVQTEVPGAGPLRVSGIVDMVRARHEGSRFDTDVFLADEGLLPVQTARAAHVLSTRFEPELYVRPRPAPDLHRPLVPRRAAGGPREHLRDLRRRDEDDVRELPLVRAVPRRRARQRGGQHQGAVFQRQGRGPPVPR